MIKIFVSLVLSIFLLYSTSLPAEENREVDLTNGIIDEILKLKNDLKSLRKELRKGLIENIDKWPSGSYCILKSGSCPVGFTSSRGALHALWMFQSQKGYVVESEFGDSKIKHHGSKNRIPDSNDWHGELTISTCCK